MSHWPCRAAQPPLLKPGRLRPAALQVGVVEVLAPAEEEQQALPPAALEAVRVLVQQRRLLQAAGGDAQQALRLLDDQPAALGVGAEVARAAAATLAALHLPARAAPLLAAVQRATSHGEAAQALGGLVDLAACEPGAAALAALDWAGALQRLLGSCPASEDDMSLWLQLLGLLRALLARPGASQPQLLFLSLAFGRAAAAWLEAQAPQLPTPAVELAPTAAAALAPLPPAQLLALRVTEEVRRRACPPSGMWAPAIQSSCVWRDCRQSAQQQGWGTSLTQLPRATCCRRYSCLLRWRRPPPGTCRPGTRATWWDSSRQGLRLAALPVCRCCEPSLAAA